MSFEAYDAFDDPYAYPGSTTLRNLLDLRDPVVLQQFEVEISTARAAEPLPDGDLDEYHYCRIHHHLFQDVYAWAGEYRTVRTSKGNHFFCFPEHIPSHMQMLFQRLIRPNRLGAMSVNDCARTLAGFLGDLNAVHPFREGNGRAQLVFLGLICSRSNRPLAFEHLDGERFLSAMVLSFSGITDPLTTELHKLMAAAAA